jgi:hypothetical protein
MKNRTFATLGLLALLATASALGQERMRVDIPFEFSTGSTVMPAGQYTVAQESQSGFTNLACYACKVDVRVLTNAGAGNNEPNKGKLVFNKYGNTYFLFSVQSPGSYGERVLPTSRAESELALRASPPRTTQIVLARR